MVRPPNRSSILALALCFLATLLIVPLGATSAQDTGVVAYGTSVTGTLPSDGAQQVYTFAGNPGDLISARVVGLTAGMDPNLTLMGPAQEVLATNENAPLLPGVTDAEMVFRLLTAGQHSLTVSGTAGDFLLTLQVRPQVQSTVLVFDNPTVAALPLNPVNQVLVFNTDPFQATTLLIDAEPFDLNAVIEVRNTTGQVVAVLGGGLDNACLSVGPGDEAHEVSILGADNLTGQITFSLSNNPCAFGPEPVTFDVTTIPFQPIAIDGVCAISSFFNLNVRMGPGLNFPVLMVLLRNTPLQVIGVSEDARWYAVQGPTFQGWIAASVSFITGPCGNLPVVPAPQAPAQAPTPGFMIITATPGPSQTPMVITGTPGPTQTAAIITNTPGPTQTAVVVTGTPAPTNTAAAATATTAPTQAGPTATTAPATATQGAEPTEVPLTLQPTTAG